MKPRGDALDDTLKRLKPRKSTPRPSPAHTYRQHQLEGAGARLLQHLHGFRPPLGDSHCKRVGRSRGRRNGISKASGPARPDTLRIPLNALIVQ